MELSPMTTECDSLFNKGPVSPPHAVRTYRSQASFQPPKRSCDSSPFDPQCDGDDANKKQLVLWRPTISQLLEQQHALTTGEVSSGLSTSNFPCTSLYSSPLHHRSSTLNPRRPSHVPYMPAKSPAAPHSTYQGRTARMSKE